MRWLKHLTDTRQDEKVARLIADAGAAGYGLWWMILEVIARRMEGGLDKCGVTYPVSKWAAELQTPPPNVRRRLAALVAAGLLEMCETEAGIELSAPNLLKYRDEWQARLGSKTRETTEQDNRVKIIHIQKQNRSEKPAAAPLAFSGKALTSITQRQDAAFAAAFPLLDLQGEYRKMDAWLVAHPERRIKRPAAFAQSWLAKAVPAPQLQEGKMPICPSPF